MLGGVPNPLSTQQFTRLAKKLGASEAFRVLRQGINDPRERAFYERQNALGQQAVDQGARVRHGGEFDHNFAAPIMSEAASMRALQGNAARRANQRASTTQDFRRTGLGTGQAAAWADYFDI